MGRPAKPAAMIKAEGKSHRTKAEIKAREENEAALCSGKKMTERPEVKADSVAHKEYVRVKKLVKNLDKNDDRFTAVLNRYCLLYSECRRYEELILEATQEISRLSADFEQMQFSSAKERMKATENFIADKTGLMRQIEKFDGILMQKRKMMLDIEKENVMTVSAALRSIPKTPEKQNNALLEALTADDDEE